MPANYTTLLSNMNIMAMGKLTSEQVYYRACKKLQILCAPLYQLGIGAFSYCRMFSNGKQLVLCAERQPSQPHTAQFHQTYSAKLEYQQFIETFIKPLMVKQKSLT